MNSKCGALSGLETTMGKTDFLDILIDDQIDHIMMPPNIEDYHDTSIDDCRILPTSIIK